MWEDLVLNVARAFSFFINLQEIALALRTLIFTGAESAAFIGVTLLALFVFIEVEPVKALRTAAVITGVWGTVL